MAFRRVADYGLPMRVLVGIDGDAQQPDALALGAELAQLDGGELIVAHVYAWPGVAARIGGAYEVTVKEDAQSVLEAAKEQLGGVPARMVLVPGGSVPRALHERAAEEHVDVLVVGSSHRSALGRALFGSVGDRLVHGSPCAVAVAPRGYREPEEGLRRIGIAYDASPESRAALRWAADLADRAGGSLTVLSVIEQVVLTEMGPVSGYPDLLEALRKERREEIEEATGQVPAKLSPHGEVLDGPPVDALARAAADLDLLVAGSRGYGPLGGTLLGSVSHGLFHHAPCPVIILPRSAEAHPEAQAETGATASAGAAD